VLTSSEHRGRLYTSYVSQFTVLSSGSHFARKRYQLCIAIYFERFQLYGCTFYIHCMYILIYASGNNNNNNNIPFWCCSCALCIIYYIEDTHDGVPSAQPYIIYNNIRSEVWIIKIEHWRRLYEIRRKKPFRNNVHNITYYTATVYDYL